MMLELEGTSRTVRHHGQLLALASPGQASADVAGWQVTVLKTVAASGEGIDELRLRLEAHREWLHTSGEIRQREAVRITNTVENILRAELNRRIRTQWPAQELQAWVAQIQARATDPYAVAEKLLPA